MEHITLAYHAFHWLQLKMFLAGQRLLLWWGLDRPDRITKTRYGVEKTLRRVSAFLGAAVMVAGVFDLSWPASALGKIVFPSDSYWMSLLVHLTGIGGGALLIDPATSGYGALLLGGMSAYSTFVYLDKNQVGEAALLLILLTFLNTIAYTRFWHDMEGQTSRNFEPHLNSGSRVQ